MRERLFVSASSADAKELEALLKKNHDYINSPLNDEKQTMLMVALEKDREYKIIELIIKYGADADKADRHKRTATMYAAKYSSDPQTIERVIRTNTFFYFIWRSQTKRRILREDDEGKCAYGYARENRNPDMALSVLRKYAPEPESQSPSLDNGGSSSRESEKEPAETSASALPTASAEAAAQTAAAAQMAAEPYTAETEAKPETAAQEKTSAQAENEPPLVQSGGSIGTDVGNAIPVARPYQKTFLFDYALPETQEDEPPEEDAYITDRVFIENANARDLNGRTKLMAAAKKGDLERIENLLYSGADINAKDNDGWSALMFAARFCPDTEVTRTLIKNGADTEQKNNYGISALKLAAGFSRTPAVVSILLAPYTVSDSEARSSFIYAITSEASEQTLDVFAARGFPVNDIYNGKTPLMYAAETNTDTRIIGWLLRKGARTSYITSSGYTAFDFARENKRLSHDSNYWALDTSGNKR